MPLIAYTRKSFKQNSIDIIARANAILVEYEEQGYDLTLRQLYYQFVSRGWIANKDSEYNRLGSIVNQARLAGLIDWDHIVDRTRFLRELTTWEGPEQIMRGAARGFKMDVWRDQDVRIEVWIEKDALVGVIERACEDLRVPFLSCRGYTSQSEMWAASQRFNDYVLSGKRVVILHLGDHDPSGIDMSRDIEERILHFLASDYYREDGNVDEDDAVAYAAENFELRRLALNWDQVQQYGPPPNPAKMTDSRGAGYVEKYGRSSWELDALEPTVIGNLIRDAVESERLEDVWEEAMAEEEKQRVNLTKASTQWRDVVRFLDGVES